MIRLTIWWISWHWVAVDWFIIHCNGMVVMETTIWWWGTKQKLQKVNWNCSKNNIQQKLLNLKVFHWIIFQFVGLFQSNGLTHSDWMMQICVHKPGHHCPTNCLVPIQHYSHYRKQLWFIINWMFWTSVKLDLKFNDFHSRKIIWIYNCKMVAILSQPQYVK